MDPRPRKPTTLGLTLRVALVSGIASAVLLAGLVWQMMAGADPAIQPAQTSPAQTSGSSGSASATTALSVDGGSSGSSANGTSRSVPAPSAPAPVVSAPAPVTSGTS